MTGNYPYDEGAERAILLSCFLSSDALYQVIGECNELDFHLGAHKDIYKEIVQTVEGGNTLDKTLINSSLGARYKPALDAIFSAKGVNPKHVNRYATVLKDLTKTRLALNAGNDILDMVEAGQPPDMIIETATELLYSAAQTHHRQQFERISDFYDEVMTKIEDREQHELTISTGISGLDSIMYGSEPDDLIIIAGRPSMGKTELVMQLAVNAALENKPVAFFSLEQPKKELLLRILANVCEVNLSKFKKGEFSRTDVQQLEAHAGTAKNLPIFIDDTAKVNITNLVVHATRLKREIPELSMIVLDYIQLLELSGKLGRVEEITRISRSLKILARTLGIPVVALSQLSRDCDKRENKRPLLSDLRDSGSIEQDADKIIFCYSDYPYTKRQEDMHKGELIVAKHRNGPVGTLEVTNHKSIQRFYDRKELDPDTLAYTTSTDAPQDEEPF